MSEKLKNNVNNTLAQICYERLHKDILNGHLKPKEKLKVNILKNRLNMGQSPIREALSRLAASGLVDIENNKGFRVAQISEKQIRDTYATFTLIETMALSLSMDDGDSVWESNIVAQLHQLKLIEEKNIKIEYEVWAEQNYNFHVALISGCNSPLFMEIRKNIYIKFDRYCRITYHTDTKTLHANHEEHKKLAELVIERKKTAAIELMKKHINEPLEEVIHILKQNKFI